MSCAHCDAKDIELERLKSLVRNYISKNETDTVGLLTGRLEGEAIVEMTRRQLNRRATLLRLCGAPIIDEDDA